MVRYPPPHTEISIKKLNRLPYPAEGKKRDCASMVPAKALLRQKEMKNVYAFLFLSMFLLMSVCVPGRAHAQVLAETGTTHFTVRIPVAVSWWTPAEKDWRGSLTGIAGVRSGVELYPHFPYRHDKHQKAVHDRKVFCRDDDRHAGLEAKSPPEGRLRSTEQHKGYRVRRNNLSVLQRLFCGKL